MNGIVENSRLENALRGMKGWLKFLGVIMIIMGIPYVIGLVGILYIWLGVLLWQAGSRAQQFLTSKSTDDLAEWAQKLKTFFVITGIVTIITLVLAIIGICIWVVMIAIGAASGGFNNY